MRSRAACVMRGRWDRTAQAAASFGEWNSHGRRPGISLSTGSGVLASPEDPAPGGRSISDFHGWAGHDVPAGPAVDAVARLRGTDDVGACRGRTRRTRRCPTRRAEEQAGCGGQLQDVEGDGDAGQSVGGEAAVDGKSDTDHEAAPGLHSQRTAAAISSARPSLPIGCSFTISAMAPAWLSSMSATMGVSITPGHTALTLIPLGGVPMGFVKLRGGVRPPVSAGTGCWFGAWRAGRRRGVGRGR